MPTVSLIKPLDQPPGTRRLLAELKTSLQSNAFTEFKLVVAYAKSGPLLRLAEHLRAWRTRGATARAILGIDQKGTSIEALQLAMELFDRVYVTGEPGITFHPKIYLFRGQASGRAFVGSNNLTVGGLEKNFEAGVRIDVDLPAENAVFGQFASAWTELLPKNCPATRRLDQAYLARLIQDGDIIPELQMRARGDDATVVGGRSRRRMRRSGLVIQPESPLPRQPQAPRAPRGGRGSRPTGPAAATGPLAHATPEALAIQIKPHHNGEIFLSVRAALQNPAFFRWPFNGQTVPKKAGNPSYPQLDPDPRVNVVVYGARKSPLLVLKNYALNTVYYAAKSEIRITASPLVPVVPDYSVMIMRAGKSSRIDYEIAIHTPASPEYARWVAVCDQEMPGGGKTPRRYGWF